LPNSSHGDGARKKSAAEKIVYGAIDRIGDKSGRAGGEAIAVLQPSLDNVKPVVEVKSARVGAPPTKCSSARQSSANARHALVIERPPHAAKSPWLIALRGTQEAAENRGAAVRNARRHSPHGEANKAFAHYRW